MEKHRKFQTRASGIPYPKEGGYFVLARALFTDEEILKGDELLAWIWLIQRAAYRPWTFKHKSSLVTVERGEVVVSVRYLEQAWRWSKTRVASFLKFLTSSEVGRLSVRRETPAGTVYLLVKYAEYQSSSEGHTAAIGTPVGTVRGQREDEENTGGEEIKIKSLSAAGAPATGKSTWLTPFSELWTEIVMGELPFGASSKPLEAVIEKLGEAKGECPETLVRWKAYLTKNAGYQPSAFKFRGTHGQYAGGAIPNTSGKPVVKIDDSEGRRLAMAYGNVEVAP